MATLSRLLVEVAPGADAQRLLARLQDGVQGKPGVVDVAADPVVADEQVVELRIEHEDHPARAEYLLWLRSRSNAYSSLGNEALLHIWVEELAANALDGPDVAGWQSGPA